MPQRTSKGRRAGHPPQGGALDAGLRLLGRRAHSAAELRKKLGRRGYDEDQVERAMARLAELGYLDDRAFAFGHVRRRSASLGPLALGAELSARGIDRATAGEALASVDPDAQLASAIRLAERACARRRPDGLRQVLDLVGPKLMRRGFAPGVIRAACKAVWLGTAEASQA